MKTIIAGSRVGFKYNDVVQAVAECGWTVTSVVSGTAMGVDTLGEWFAVKNQLPLKKYPADWTMWGKSAGYKRNEVMAKNAEALIALWDGGSRGTKHMIDIAQKAGLPVYIYYKKDIGS